MRSEAITLREATALDLPSLLKFEQAVIQAERPFAQDLKDSHIHYYNIPELIESSLVQVVVAELDHTLVGCGYARIEESKPYKRSPKHAYLGFMYVAPECRGLGLNKRIIEKHINWANQQGVRDFKLDVYNANEAAISAYLKSGFNANLLEMVMSN